MNIQIFSAENAAKELKQHQYKWHVVSLRDYKYATDNHPVSKVEENAKAMIVCQMDDVNDYKYESWGYRPPKHEQVEEVLKWVEEHDPKNLIVHCWAGVSRSSAMAYVIACTKVTPTIALKMLDNTKHQPNELIVMAGSTILKDQEIWRKYCDWKSKSAHV